LKCSVYGTFPSAVGGLEGLGVFLRVRCDAPNEWSRGKVEVEKKKTWLIIFTLMKYQLNLRVMRTTYHFNSATEITADILEAIKIVFKTKAVTITITENEDDTDFFNNRPHDKVVLLQSIKQAKNGSIIKNVIAP
jgi:hypothetical protein